MLTLIALLAQTAQALSPATPAAVVADPPHRIYDTRSRMFVDDFMMVWSLSKADVVMFGEQHDDPGTHAMEAYVLGAIGRPGARKILAMEMFERDVQPVLDAYLVGRVPEDSLMSLARPWPRYATDYRPMVELAKLHRWPVIAGNVPRPLASAVSKSGLGMLDSLDATRRSWVATDIQCGHDSYFDRFAETMRPHVPGATDADKAAALELYYQAQCIKDETMAEAVVRAMKNVGNDALVMHVNGAFHSDFRLGTAARIQRRLPDARMMVVTGIPVADLTHITVSDEDIATGDFLIYTQAPPAADSTAN